MKQTSIPTVCVIIGYGINADLELAEAFNKAGGRAERVHIQDLITVPSRLSRYDIVAFPGGFSFGDHLGSGKVLAALCKQHLQPALTRFVTAGKPVIGICNGFQTLVKMGILPNLSGDWKQDVSLIHNDSGLFEDRWVHLKINPHSPCIWTRGLARLELPVRHGEGKFVVGSDHVRKLLVEKNLIALQYTDQAGDAPGYPGNPNGSLLDIAGISDPSGLVFGLMPHPEAFLFSENHPRWTREKIDRAAGLFIFERGIDYVRSRK
ncbi:MAG TPA: phosphoribosylformylglycinamidine synthase subunit PurQ [Spirochaetia bacterium]|nr:phosphoribosylformylglycinamidine synthase subunit PurQ [Spirochaetia bacterium]